MNIFQTIKNFISQHTRLNRLNDNPKGEKYRFINDEDEIIKQHLEEYKIWYVGDSDELLNYYTNQVTGGFAKNVIYNRNKENYFWGINVSEKIKRVHSGLPHDIVSTLCNVVDIPEISVANGKEDLLKEILDENDFNVLLNQQARPLTLVEGYGAYKIYFDKNLRKHPIIQYYEAQDVEYIVEQGIITGIIYKDYYKYNDKDYVFLETRSVEENNSLIQFQLFRLESKDQVTPVPLDTIPALGKLPKEGHIIKGLNKILGVPSKYFFDATRKNYGRSIFQGKLDLFDDLDQSLSQRSQTCRKSTPIDYIPEDMLERGKSGELILPDTYNRQFVKYPAIPNGDGDMAHEISTTQPVLNFDQYSQEQISILNTALTGILSLATLGVDIAKKDNAEAQREKEKVTIMTRNNIITMETDIIKELCTLLLMVQEYMDNGVITIRDYDISVKYSEFANPSFESLSATLTPMYTSGAISTKMYVEKLYGDSLSDEEKEQEIAWLEQKSQQDNLQMGDFDLNGAINENELTDTLSEQE